MRSHHFGIGAGAHSLIGQAIGRIGNPRTNYDPWPRGTGQHDDHVDLYRYVKRRQELAEERAAMIKAENEARLKRDRPHIEAAAARRAARNAKRLATRPPR